ncbi:TSUP family transporter [Demequina zhanjiangensis]|uniref:Probable membrane transporter protein n=1 Tax=Demequina zhanjiangensis TaxID=3051659 RepID=A0ABT8FYP3_9MICO|nr:TSUP family transporter [Demequina sp. SYSU T00b26]MDN4471559.1 TSUP family transporter [Demequina sp. SYSU T00b26]
MLLALAVAAFAAGLLDTLAGGGGLITVPALLLAGVPPVQALGTNKLQGSFGTLTATVQVLRKHGVAWRDVRGPMLVAFAGSAAGSIVILFVDPEALEIVIPIVLAAIAAYFLLVRDAHMPPPRARMTRKAYVSSVVPAIGAYDGAFGPGTGSLFALGGVALRGFDLRRSTALAKTLNFATNVAALIVFVAAGKVVWLLGGLMALGQLAGAWLGSHLLLRVNPMVLRVLIVVVSVAMLVRFLLG